MIALKNKNNIGAVDQVIFLDGFGYYEQEFLTKMRLAFDFSGVCCYGEQDETIESVIKKSFGNDKEVQFYSDYHILPIDGAICTYALNGHALEIETNDDKNACIFSQVDGVDYSSLGKDYALIIAKDRVEQLYNFYKPTKFISYCDSSQFISADTLGTQTVKIKEK